MNERSTSSALPRHDGLTPLALAAGLAFGHLVLAMADFGEPGALTAFSALVFVITASAGTLCALASMAARDGAASARGRIGRWVLALGAGFLGALAPTLF